MLFSKLIKDINQRKTFAKLEYKFKAKKYTFINIISTLKLLGINRKPLKKKRFFRRPAFFRTSGIYKSLYFSYSLQKSGRKVKLARRCLLTNRGKSVYRSFNFSRLVFRDLLQFGVIPGYKKAVW